MWPQGSSFTVVPKLQKNMFIGESSKQPQRISTARPKNVGEDEAPQRETNSFEVGLLESSLSLPHPSSKSAANVVGESEIFQVCHSS